MKIFCYIVIYPLIPLLRTSSSRSLKCTERNWPMYSLLRLPLVQEYKCIQEVLDNRAWTRNLSSSVHDIFYTFKEIIQFKQVYSYPKVDMYHPFYVKILTENLHQIQFLNRSIENRDPLHRRSARRKTNSISNIVIQKFLITRNISLKKNLIQLQVKKKHKKSLHGK